MTSLDTDMYTGRMSCEHEGRDWGDTHKPPEARREEENRFCLTAL